jgi:hypothetical protein
MWLFVCWFRSQRFYTNRKKRIFIKNVFLAKQLQRLCRLKTLCVRCDGGANEFVDISNAFVDCANKCSDNSADRVASTLWRALAVVGATLAPRIAWLKHDDQL